MLLLSSLAAIVSPPRRDLAHSARPAAPVRAAVRRSANDLHRLADGDDARLEHAAVDAHHPAGLETGAAQDLGIDLGRVGVDGRDHAALAALPDEQQRLADLKPAADPALLGGPVDALDQDVGAKAPPVVTELRDGAVGDDEERR